jgi:hypothetical protein
VTWNGIVDTPLPGSFSLAITGTIVEGTLSTASGETYAISGRPDELVYTRVAAQTPFLCPVIPGPAGSSEKAAAAVSRQTEDTSEVDILVVYTAAVKAALGGSSGSLNSIRGAVAYTNQAFANSGVPTTLNLVGVSEVEIAESGSCLYDLFQLNNSATVAGGVVERLRAQSGADLVSLWTADGDCGGIAFLLTNPNGSPSASLSITVLAALNRFQTFAHEIGHNLGANHDRGNAGTVPGLFPYSYGFQNATGEPAFRDLMAYECLGAPCPRQPYFSNPSVSVFGRPIGIAAPANNSADAAATFRLSAPVVASYRQRVVNPNPPPYVTLSTNQIAPPPSGGRYTITVKSNLAWQASSDSSWLPFTASGQGDGTVIIPVSAVSTVGPRSARIYFRGDSTEEYIDVRQTGVTVSFDPPLLRIAAGATSGQIRLRLSDNTFASNLTVLNTGSWITLSPLTGTGSRTLQFSATQNTTGTYRFLTVNLGDTNFQLSQEAATVTTTSPIVTFPAAGGTVPLAVKTEPYGSNWTASAFSESGWLTTTPRSGQGNREVALTATPNPRSADRTATLSIGSDQFTVVQRGVRCASATPIAVGAVINGQLPLTPSCTSSYLGDAARVAHAARYTFSATAGDTVRILMESGVLDSVLYLTGPSGELVAQDDNSGPAGNAAVPSPSGWLTLPQTGTYTIEATSYSGGVFTLRLSGSTPAVATLLPQTVNLPNTGGTGTLSVSVTPSSLAWSASATAAGEWLRVNPSSGAGNGTIGYTYFANPSTSPRTATVYAAGQTVTLVQAAGLPAVFESGTLSPPTGPDTRSTGPLYSVTKDSRFLFRFTHPAGFDNLDVVNVLINSALDGGGACYLAYSRAANVLYLVNDAGPDAGLSALVLGSNASVANSQCRVYGAESSALVTGNELSLTVRIEFLAAFAGYKAIFLAARDSNGGNSGWNTHGGVAIPELPAVFPRSGPVEPAATNLFEGWQRFSFQHDGSVNNLGTLWVLMNSAVDARNACYVAYFVPGRLLFLLPDNGDAAQATSIRISTPGVLENSQCRIDVRTSSAFINQGEVALSLNILFKAGLQQKPFGIWTATQTVAAPGAPARTSPWTMVGGRLPSSVF